MAPVLRLATPGDFLLLCQLEQACFPLDAWQEAGVSSHLASGCAFTSLAEVNGVPVGYLAATVIPPEGEVLRIGVLPEYRGSGVGLALLTDFFARRGDIGACFLEVRRSNLPALSLYRKAGFLEVGVRRQYYTAPKEDALILKWERKKYCADPGI